MATVPLQVGDDRDCWNQAKAPIEKVQQCVLLIDDSEDAMLLIRYALREYGEEGYRLEWANTLRAGIEQISKGGVDIVLLDLGLPECSGPASYACVRESAPGLPIVVITGDSRQETDLELTAGGVEDYLIKEQVSGPLLLQAIRIALYAKRQRLHSKTMTGKLTRRALLDLP